MQMNEECRINTWPFDVSKTKLSAKFMAGRGKVLLEVSRLPLQAQEFAKRKKIQELLLKGEFKLDQYNIPKDLLRLNTAYTPLKNAKTDETINSTSMESGIKYKDFLHDSGTTTGSEFKIKKVQSNGVDSDQGVQMSSLTTDLNLNKCLPKERTLKDYGRKNGMGAKPLRKPDKSRKQYINPIAIKSNDSKTEFESKSEVESVERKGSINDKDVWVAWEKNVVVQGSLADEDLSDIATLGDNDDIHDVIVDQYIDALQQEQNNGILRINNHKLTPNRVQQLSNLKSTSNADCVRLSPGTQPNLPKGDDRWGGSELNGMSPNMGWGVPEHDNRNQYDDGSSMWSVGGSHYGGISWSEAS